MVFVLLVSGFEELEALAPLDILRRGGVEVQTVGVRSLEVVGAHGLRVVADAILDSAAKEQMTMLVLPGGPGHRGLLEAKEWIAFAADKGLPIGAICAAPSILGELGYLQGRRAVCFPGCEGALRGAVLESDSVVTDGPITTARGAGVSLAFGFRLLRILRGEKVAKDVWKQMQCRQ